MNYTETLESQITRLLEEHPRLSTQLGEDAYLLTGILVLNAEYAKIPLYDEYSIEIKVPFDFPIKLPLVRSLDDMIPDEFEHTNADGGLCLGAECDLYAYIEEHNSLSAFINVVVMSYLYSASYFRRYGKAPYGERSHGIQGIIEAYCERYSVQELDALMNLLLITGDLKPYRGHLLCPCNSGKRLRQCHGTAILKDMQSPMSSVYKSDAREIIGWYILKLKERKEYRGNKCTAEK